MTRDEFLVNTYSRVKRGMDLPQTKLPPGAIKQIRECAAKREQLRKEITEKYSNAALAKKWGVSLRTIDNVIGYKVGKHVL